MKPQLNLRSKILLIPFIASFGFITLLAIALYTGQRNNALIASVGAAIMARTSPIRFGS